MPLSQPSVVFCVAPLFHATEVWHSSSLALLPLLLRLTPVSFNSVIVLFLLYILQYLLTASLHPLRHGRH